MSLLFTLTLQIAVILVVSRLTGNLFRLIRQPRVVGEMFAGILMGPSLLGWLFPGLSTFLFPPQSLMYLNVLSQIGLIVFMFLVGLGMNTKELDNQGHATILTSHVSITVPFFLGSLLSLYLYPRLSDDSVSFTSYGLFVGAAMSITAFPVLARILTERNMLQSRLGVAAIACAAVDDVTGWCILAYIILLIRASDSPAPFLITLGGLAVFILVMIYGVRRYLRRFEAFFREHGALSENLLALMIVLILLSALCTEWLGVHLIFGAFLLGAIMPKERKFVQYIYGRLETITVILLLPLFFAFIGLKTRITLINGAEMWICCGSIIIVAIVGKLGGSMLAAGVMRMPLQEAAGLGILMNTRGLMELVVLNIGLDLKIISPALFSMMVIMALLTTLMTTPLLRLIYPDREVEIETANRKKTPRFVGRSFARQIIDRLRTSNLKGHINDQ